MNAPVKFLFDNNLEAPQAPPAIAHDVVEALKTAHAAELIKAREDALQLGREQGQAEAKKSIEHDLYRHLDVMVQNKELYAREIDAKLEATRSSSVLLAMSIARKLAGSLLARYPVEHIEQFFNESLSLFSNDAILRLHVAPGLAKTLQPRLEAMLERNGQKNALQTVTDEEIDGVTCKLQWAQGGIEQNTEELFAQIEKLIETCLYAQKPPVNTLAGA